MRDRLTATLTIESQPPGASVRLNGVAVGDAPVRLERLPTGPVRVGIRVKDQQVSRQIELRGGVQSVQLGFGTPAGGNKLLAALVAGDEAAARRAARALSDDGVCAGLVVGGRVWLLRFVGDQVSAEQDVLPAALADCCLLYTSPSPRDRTRSRMPSSA